MSVRFIDTTLRDGHQSLWATRMTTSMMLPILATIDRVGYHSIEFLSSAHMDSCVRYLGENPWDRIRLVRRHVRNTPLRMLALNQNFSISRVLSDDVVELFVRTCVRAGVDHLWTTAAMNDARTAEVSIRTAKDAGSRVEGGVQFTVSPVHTDEFFVKTTEELVALGIDAIILKDAGGLLTPERARSLVPLMKKAAQGLPLYCHSHCVTGMGPAANLAAIEHGVEAIWTCSRPLANGASLPAAESMMRHLEWQGRGSDLDAEAMKEVSDYFSEVARSAGLPLGQPAEYDPAYYDHQMPGGMISNFRSQLREIGMGDRLDEVLEEMPQVREDLGWPNVQTPFSQFVGTQAFLNVLYGRYEVIADETRQLALGYWGRTPGPVKADVLDKVGDGAEPVTSRPGGLVEPMVERVRRQQGPFHSDEELLLAILFMPELLTKLKRAEAERGGMMPAAPSSVLDLVRVASRSKDVKRFHFVAGSQ